MRSRAWWELMKIWCILDWEATAHYIFDEWLYVMPWNDSVHFTGICKHIVDVMGMGEQNMETDLMICNLVVQKSGQNHSAKMLVKKVFNLFSNHKTVLVWIWFQLVQRELVTMKKIITRIGGFKLPVFTQPTHHHAHRLRINRKKIISVWMGWTY
jgi:hypothetical protein